jgi:GMP synthase (glutamine-hydrolysing)
MSHGDKVTQIPKGFKLLATSAKCHYAMIGDVNRNLYGIQFHPEVNHTINGKHFLANFVFNVCRATNNWTMNSFVNQQINFIKQKVGNEKVLCALSGGVDSSVTAALIAKAINKNLTCLFVDHGMLRLGEADRVTKTFKDHFHVNFIRVNAANIFLKKLSNVIDPESKRKIIGKTFIQIFERYAKKIKNLK